LSGGEGVDEYGESDLDGFAVFEGGEFEALAGDEVVTGGCGWTEGGVALVETVVEVATLPPRQNQQPAMQSRRQTLFSFVCGSRWFLGLDM
jgi:hypothetical protein